MKNKKEIVIIVKKQIPHPISYYDIFSVVSILIDEIRRELSDGNKIDIPNFGTFSLEKFKPKIIKNIRNDHKPQYSKPYNALRFRIAPRIIKKILENCEKNAAE